jgi:hypothetical protein
MEPGAVIHFFLLTLVMTAILSPIAIWRYAAAVLAGMRTSGGGELPLPLPAPPGAGPHAGPAERLAWERGAHGRAAAGWLVVTGLAALPLAAVYLVAGDLPRTPLHLALVLFSMLLVAIAPIALSLGWTFAESFRRGLLGVAIASVLLLAMSLLQRLAQGRAPSWDQALNLFVFVQFAAAMMGLPLLLLLASSVGRVRGVVPMTFGGLVIFGAAPYAASSLWQAIGASEAGSRAMLETPWLGSRHLLLLLVVLPFAAAMAWRLSALASAYAAKRFSDVQLLARAWWLMFVALVAIELLNARHAPAWSAVLAALCVLPFAPLQRGVFRGFDAARGAPPPASLLLLRVFGFRSRTERLFDRIGARWRWHGPVTMIAAPDVVSRTIDAVDFLDWLLGRSGSNFVRDADELRVRLAAIDQRRDPDGRFRVSEFCCADNTWRATVVELMQRADVVLMDLRGITRERKGCEFELQQLARRLPPGRVVLVVEPGADRSLLAAALGGAAAQVHWFEMARDTRASNRALFEALLRGASTGAVLSAAAT